MCTVVFEMQYRRTYIEVTAKCDTTGVVTPLEIAWQDRHYSVDRIIDVRRRAATKAGGGGIRYICMIQGRERYLFLDEYAGGNCIKWFVEERIDAL